MPVWTLGRAHQGMLALDISIHVEAAPPKRTQQARWQLLKAMLVPLMIVRPRGAGEARLEQATGAAAARARCSGVVQERVASQRLDEERRNLPWAPTQDPP